jgi:hypothetical protein
LKRADLVLLYFLAAAYQVHCLNLLTATYAKRPKCRPKFPIQTSFALLVHSVKRTQSGILGFGSCAKLLRCYISVLFLPRFIRVIFGIVRGFLAPLGTILIVAKPHQSNANDSE